MRRRLFISTSSALALYAAALRHLAANRQAPATSREFQLCLISRAQRRPALELIYQMCTDHSELSKRNLKQMVMIWSR